MARVKVIIADELTQEAREARRTRTRQETIIVALREATRRQRLLRAMEHRGRLDLDLTRERLAELRDTR
jgi:hypothetical protein